jgi:serine/threonine-protein kinase RsbW
MSAAGKGPRSTVSAHTAYDLATRSGEQATLRFASGHGHATKAVRDIAAFLLGAGLSPGLVEDASIALAEALNNIEEHAYSGRPEQPVLVEIDARGDCFRCCIEDCGVPLPGGMLPGGRLPSADPGAHDDLPEGGFGWALLRRLTRDLAYQRQKDRNRLTFSIS